MYNKHFFDVFPKNKISNTVVKILLTRGVGCPHENKNEVDYPKANVGKNK